MDLTTKTFSTRCKEVYEGAVRIGVINQLANDLWAAYTLGKPAGVRIEGIPLCASWEEVLDIWKEKRRG
jgi:hypothetical protein